LRRRLGSYAKVTAPRYTWESIAARREDFFYRVIDDFRQAHHGATFHNHR
jgi:hypothetical protein